MSEVFCKDVPVQHPMQRIIMGPIDKNGIYNAIMLVALFSLEETLGERWTNHFPPAPFFFFLSGDQLAHTNSTSSFFLFLFFKATISPQWLSELRQLWPSVS